MRNHKSHTPARIWRNCIAGRSWGWMVQYIVDQVTVRRFFSDSTYGTSAKARAAAQRFAHAHVDLHLELLALKRRLTVRRNSASGIPGVSRYEGADRGPYWVAYWDDESGCKRHKKFSVAVYGERDAKARAVAARQALDSRHRKRLQAVRSLLSKIDEGLKAAHAA